MGMFDSIFQNEAFQKFAFGQLRGIIAKEGYEMMVLRLDPEDGALIIEMFKPGEATLTVHKVAALELSANLLPEKTDTDATNQNS